MWLTLLFSSNPLLAQVSSPGNTEGPKWYKGNLHTHSLWSDGDDFPEMITDWYKRRGYHFLCLSDHNILSIGDKWISQENLEKRGGTTALEKYRARFPGDWVECKGGPDAKDLLIRLKPLHEFRSSFEVSGEFLMIPSEEITDKGIHLNATNIAVVIEPQGGPSLLDQLRNNLRAVAAQVEQTGTRIVPHLNHPNLGGQGVSAEDLAGLVENHFFEVWNGVEGDGDLGSSCRHSLEKLWDITSSLRLSRYQSAPMYALATDDSHDYHGGQRARPGRGWIMVRAAELSVDALLDSLERGDFYASTGVELSSLEFDTTTGLLSIEICPQGDAVFTTNFIGTLRDFDSTTKPRIDPQTGETIPGILDYSTDVGQVLSTSNGLRCQYRLTGRELYVRAEVTSNRPPEFPTTESPFQKAWTQPVGWSLSED